MAGVPLVRNFRYLFEIFFEIITRERIWIVERTCSAFYMDFKHKFRQLIHGSGVIIRLFFEYGEFEKEKLHAATLEILIFQLKTFACPDLFFERQSLTLKLNRNWAIENKVKKASL